VLIFAPTTGIPTITLETVSIGEERIRLEIIVATHLSSALAAILTSLSYGRASAHHERLLLTSPRTGD
jgi:hypothetical protein